MRPFSLPYFLMLLATAAVSLLLHQLLRNQPQDTKHNALIAICILNFITFFVYKIVLSCDQEYLVRMGQDRFSWLTELPLHLCNTNLYLLPISLAVKKKPLMLFSFCTATLGALLAITLPDNAFVGYPLLMPRVFFYYLTHAMLVVCAVNLVSLGFYRPRFRDIPAALLCFLLLGLAAHGINLLIRATAGVDANYFYTLAPCNGTMDLFWSLIPIPFVYLLLPAFLVVPAYMLLICLVYRLAEKRIPQ